MYVFVKKTNIYFHRLKRDKERLQIIANVLPVAYLVVESYLNSAITLFDL